MTKFRFLDLPDIRIRAVVEGQGPLVVMVHGFPESWFSWRHQIGPIAQAGFTACAIDVRGYGGSGRPHAIADYDMEHMIADVCGVIDAMGARTAILIGHDWGAPIVWNTALARPDRIRAVAGLSVPFTGAPLRSMSAMIEEIFTSQGRFFYQHYFQDAGVAEREGEADIRGFLRKFYYAISGDAPDGTWPKDKVVGDSLLYRLPDPDPFPAWLTAADLDYYVREFEQSGLRGPINRYRNHDRDFEFLKAFQGKKIEQPSLFVGGARDLVLSMFGRADLMGIMKMHMSDLRGADVLEGCGHWTQQERPDEVNARLIPWLKSL
ncbi:MAG: alpha/beta fold hydrolase [Alphaproteobacteria bacterium]|nr:alpha/beta fold hydrolase [Alphaproteobacteria bacterium]